MFRRLDPTEKAEGDTATTTAGHYADMDALDPIDVIPILCSIIWMRLKRI
jgi:hypothetical protein